MSKHFRIRAWVDGKMEERIVIAESPTHAMREFGELVDEGSATKFKDYPIFVAMVHVIAFDETGPVYTDVTAHCRLTENGFKRAPFNECLRYLTKAK